MNSDSFTKRRWIGILVLLIYWSSFVWLKLVFDLFGISPQDHLYLAAALETYFLPLTFLIPKMGPLFRYNFYVIWYAPIVAMIFGMVVFSVVWWFLAPLIRKRNAASAT
jgi:hypothetical protein